MEQDVNVAAESANVERKSNGLLRILGWALAIALLVAAVVGFIVFEPLRFLSDVNVEMPAVRVPPGLNAGQSSAAPTDCVGCHSYVSSESMMWLGVNGVELQRGKNVEVRAGESFEVDFHFTNILGNPGKFMGVGIQVVVPADPRWQVANGTYNYPKGWSPQGSGLSLWSNKWDRGANGDAGGLIQWIASEDVPGSYHLSFADATFAASAEISHGAVQADRGKDDPSDRDGVANHAGADMLISVPAGTAPGDYTVKIYGIGHDRRDRLANVEYSLVVTVVGGKREASANVPAGVTGASIYVRNCSGCHGQTPNTQTVQNVRSKDMEELQRSVQMGKGSMKPQGTAAGGKLSDGEIAAALEYIAREAKRDTRKLGPMIQHGLVGKENRCLDCHASDRQRPVPVTHRYANSDCLTCHPAPPRMSHPADGRAACSACHNVPDAAKSGGR